MKSLIQYSVGGPEVLELAEVPKPVRNFTEVLVRVHAASINPVDLIVRSGVFPILGAVPFVPGWDVSGVVEEIEVGSTRFKVGDEIFGMPLFPRAANAYAEYVAAPSRHFWKKPERLSHAQAAALPLVGLTALQALSEIAQVEPGQRVLIHGGGGGLGHIAVQIAKALGAHVITTASAGKHEFVRSLGADEVIDYQSVDFTTVLSDIDVVFDTVGHGYAERSLPVLKPDGIVVTSIGLSNGHLPALAEAAGRRFSSVAVEPDSAGMEQLAAWVESGQLTPHVSHEFPLSEGAQAHALVEQGSTLGKVVLRVAS
jgi:NADPH:quinone reductase-like Zn-dependent oxidoreductase